MKKINKIIAVIILFVTIIGISVNSNAMSNELIESELIDKMNDYMNEGLQQAEEETRAELSKDDSDTLIDTICYMIDTNSFMQSVATLNGIDMEHIYIYLKTLTKEELIKVAIGLGNVLVKNEQATKIRENPSYLKELFPFRPNSEPLTFEHIRISDQAWQYMEDDNNLKHLAETYATELGVQNFDGLHEYIVDETIKISNSSDNDWLDEIFGVLLYPIKFIIILVGYLLEFLIEKGIGGISGVGEVVNLQTILFNNVSITSLNFFEFNVDASNVVKIREAVAAWYYTTRNFAIIVALCVLIYTGVRMAMSSIASDKAKYKQMLTNWVVRIYTYICTSIYNSWYNTDK